MQERLLFTAVTIDKLVEMRQFIEKTGKSWGLNPEDVADMVIAANEATTNIIVHGYGEQAGEIEIIVTYQDETFLVTLLDQAPPFDPTNVAAPDLLVSPLARQPGGLGIMMINEFIDTLEYHLTKDGKNKLILSKGVSNAIQS